MVNIYSSYIRGGDLNLKGQNFVSNSAFLQFTIICIKRLKKIKSRPQPTRHIKVKDCFKIGKTFFFEHSKPEIKMS